MDHIYKNIHGYSDNLIAAYENFIKNNNKSHLKIVEVGVYLGRSASYLAVELYNKNISFDLHLVDNNWDKIGRKEFYSSQHQSRFEKIMWLYDRVVNVDEEGRLMVAVSRKLMYFDKKEDFANVRKENFKFIDEVTQNFKYFSDKVIFHQMDSKETSEKFDDNSVDLICLDANHEYESISADIKYWYPKLKYGGWIIGDDYCDQRGNGVKKAVIENFKDFWLIDNNGTIQKGDEKLSNGAWFLQKN